jgi:hypothetical protein
MDLDSDSDHFREMYSNLFKIGFNSAEFLLDFGRSFEDGEETFHQRIITAPVHAKQLSHLLDQSVQKYEEKFGPMPESPESEEGTG